MEQIKNQAYGSLMLCGEHSVVFGYPALVLAISQKITAILTPRGDKNFVIKSSLGDFAGNLENLKNLDFSPLSFVLETIRQNPPLQGFLLEIKSEIDPNLGFGSSAAVVAAVLKTLIKYRGEKLSLLELHNKAHEVILKIQGRGSGADLAAALAGGLVFYQKNAGKTQILPLNSPNLALSVRYAGYKTKTAKVLEIVAKKAAKNPEFFKTLYENMGEITLKAVNFLKNQNFENFYLELENYQLCLEKLGVCDEIQKGQILEAKNFGAKGVKISGSGLGDCIISFAEKLPPKHQIIHSAPKEDFFNE